MVLMALAMMAILAMAALSIDVVTLYLANAEAQRSADTAALAAARVLSISGMTGDPSNNPAGLVTNPWQQACALATSVATAVAIQNTMGGEALTPGQVKVTFPNNSDRQFCTGSDLKFGVNPLVTVKVQRADLPTFFARIWRKWAVRVGATATAEAFNSSNSGNAGNSKASGTITAVQPRCVKPWMVPNLDPGSGTCVGYPAAGCKKFVSPTDGSIVNSSGIVVNGTGSGVVGESFNLFADCKSGSKCSTPGFPPPTDPPQANVSTGTFNGISPPILPNLEYLPGAAQNTSTAVPSCSVSSSPYEETIEGCDQNTVYQCGVQSSSASNPNMIDLDQNPGGPSGDTLNGVQCLTTQGTAMGGDVLDTTVYPYQIKAGASNPLLKAGLSKDSVITASSSIVSLPIYDSSPTDYFTTGQAAVTIVGFLQVFINSVDTTNGSVNVTVLNVSGCGNGSAGSQPVAGAVMGTSPVPVRLITYP
jgi:hypothetical protein